MKKTARALVSWVPTAKGGRRTPFVGDSYTTVARFADDPAWPNVAWTLVVKRLRTFSGGRFWFAELQFLADEAPTELLKPGARFDLFEGRRLTATGLIRTRPPQHAREMSSVLLT